MEKNVRQITVDKLLQVSTLTKDSIIKTRSKNKTMKPVGRLKRLLGMAVAVGALVGITAQAAPIQNKAVVRAVRGTANYSTDRGANWKKLNVGATLMSGSVVRTAPGSLVDLFLGENGPVVRITEDTTMGIDQLTMEDLGQETIIETQLDLRNGRILGNVKKLAAASRYEVKTPQGVAGIRGTRYDISADGTVTVIEGQVQVVYIVNNQPVSVTVNAGETARPPLGPDQPARVTSTPVQLIQNINQQLETATAAPPAITTTPVVVIPVQTAPNPDPIDTLPRDEIESPINPGT